MTEGRCQLDRSYRFIPRKVHRLKPGWTVWASPLGYVLWLKRRGWVVGVHAARWRFFSSDEQRAQLRAAMVAVLMKSRKSMASGPLMPHAPYGDMLEPYPALAEWFTDPVFEDGRHRQGGWCSVYARGGVWRFKLSDNADGMEIELNAPSWLEGWKLCEGAVLDPSAPWRPIPNWVDPALPKKKKKK